MRHITDSCLLTGNARDARDIRSLKSHGIEAVIDVSLEDMPVGPSRDIIYFRVPLIDGEGNEPVLIDITLYVVAYFARNNIKTLVACSGGMSRSPAIVAATIARVRNISFDSALAIVLEGAPGDVSPPLYAQLALLVSGESKTPA